MALASSAGCALASQQHSIRSPLIPIRRCAASPIKRFGETADVEIAARADALLTEGTTRGSAGGRGS